MGRKSSISRLPVEIKAYIERRLSEGQMTLDELIADLQAAFPQTALPSRGAVHRYGKKLEQRLAAIRASTEAARIIDETTGDEKDTRSGAIIALVQSELFETIVNLQEATEDSIDPAERIKMLSAAAKNIATLTRASVTLKKYQGEVAAKVASAAEKAETIARKGGLSADSVQALRREILGIAS